MARIRADLAEGADPARAAAQQAYMKSAMPFHGVTMPQVRAIGRRHLTDLQMTSCDDWQQAVLTLWRGARFREERYVAMMLAGDRRFESCRTPKAIPMLEEMIVSGAWWDHVDEAAHLIGRILRAHPKPMRRVMRSWSKDANLWKRRVSIICQISFKKDTDLELLYGNIETNFGDRDFFIRKAIGWALRAYAWTDPAEVVRYVRENESRLSGLSRREALKNVPLTMR